MKNEIKVKIDSEINHFKEAYIKFYSRTSNELSEYFKGDAHGYIYCLWNLHLISDSEFGYYSKYIIHYNESAEFKCACCTHSSPDDCSICKYSKAE